MECRILEIGKLNPHAISMTLLAGAMMEEIHCGQFLHIRCGEGRLLRRPLSICHWQTQPEGMLLRVVFEVRGEGTAWLARRRKGEVLDVLGPLGNGFPVRLGERCLLVGGGIGVPPLLGCAAVSGNAAAILGFRSAQYAMLAGDFRAAGASVQIATDDGSLGYHGFVDALMRSTLERDSGYDAVMACGPRPMLRSVAAVAKEAGIPCLVSMEERMGCGVGACLVCACDMADGSRKKVCSDGPVFPAEEVDWDA